MGANTQVLSERVLNTYGTQANIQKHANRIRIAENVSRKAGRGSLTLEKKAALATCLENTRKICEATNASMLPSKTFFLDMVASVIPNSIAADIVSIQAMDAKAGMISYLRFVYGTNKGQVKEGQMFNSSLYHGVSDVDYSSRNVNDEPLVSGVNLSSVPVIEGTIVITKADGTTDAVTYAGGVATSASGTTIDLATGAVGGTAPAADTVISYEYNNEDAPVDVPEINLELAQIPVFAKSRKLAAYWGFDAAFDLKQQYGEDITSLMAAQASGEITYEIDTEICLDLYKQAGNDLGVWSKTPNLGVQLIDHYDSFWAKLTEGANIVFGATQRFTPNFIVCGINVSAVIEVMRNFDGTGASTGVGPHLIGTLGGKYKVYVVPQMDPDGYVMGYKGGNFLETGYVYAPYMPVLSTQILTLANFQGQQGYATSYGKRMVNSRLYVRGKISA